MKVFYITDIFPSLSQTFVSREIAALENLGVEIGMLSLYDRSKDEPRHGVNDRLRCIPRYGSDLRCGKAGKAASHLGALASNGLRYVDAFRGTQTPGLPSMKYVFRDLPLYCQTICRFGAHHVHAHFSGSVRPKKAVASFLLAKLMLIRGNRDQRQSKTPNKVG